MEPTINPEYANLVRKLSESEYKELKESISKRGLHIPIVVNQKGEILDGHNRFKICQELGIEPAFVIKEFDDPEEEKIFVIEANIQRRQLSDFDRIELVHKIQSIEAQRAEKRRLANLKTFADDEESSGSNEPLGEETGRVREIMAEKAGVSPSTYYRGAVVLESGNQEVIQAVKDGKKSINEAYVTVTAKEKEKVPSLKKVKVKRGPRKQVIQALQEDEDADTDETDVWLQEKVIVGAGKEVEIST
jgi:ParB-like chromosome segregation protein Spo0J